MTSIHNTSDAGRVLLAEKMHHRFTNKITRQQAVVVVLAIFIIFIVDESLKTHMSVTMLSKASNRTKT